MEKTVSMILEHAGLKTKTVGNYAVIDWGFDIIYADGTQEPAGAIVRQAAHRANLGNHGMLEPRQQVKIEEALRRYGLTSMGDGLRSAHRLIQIGVPRPSVNLNVQGTASGALIDFGHYTAYQPGDFDRITASPAATDFQDREKLLQYLDDMTRTPDENLKVPDLMYGQSQAITDPVLDRITIYSGHLAKSLQKDFNREHVTQHFKNFLKPLQKKLHSISGAHSRCGALF